MTIARCQRQFPKEADLEQLCSSLELMLSSYGANDYPWTRLGYTDDWGRTEYEVGAREFVIASEATVAVGSVQTTEECCRDVPDF